MKEKYKADYHDISHEFPIVKERLLYGVDWHVMKRVENYRNFKNDYVEVLRYDMFTEDDIQNFLGGNSLKFLGLLPGEQNRERISNFYNKHNITPPNWFQETA
jgi:hypothetical protein